MSEVKETSVWQSLMDAAYERWQNNRDWDYDKMLNSCSSIAERVAVLFGNLNYQVENGGFGQWVDNGYALKGEEIIAILKQLHEEGVPHAEALAERIVELLDYVDLKKKRRGWDDYWLKATSPFDDSIDWDEGQEVAKEMDDWYYKEIQPEFVPALEKWLEENKEMKSW